MKKKAAILLLCVLVGLVGCVKNIDATETGALITFEDGTGYYIEK